MVNTSLTTRVLAADDTSSLRQMLDLFAEAFYDPGSYAERQPSDSYLAGLRASDTFMAVAGFIEGKVAGGLAGYVLHKFEQERKEFYIYDLAVSPSFRRQGVATALISTLQAAAARKGIYVIFVQADYGDDPVVALYTKLGTREDVMHFDILPSDGAA